MEPGEEENIPVKGIQDKLIQYWNEYPEILQKMFQKAFLDGGRLRELRPTEVDWKQLLVRMAMDYKSCHCGFHGFSYRLLPKENGTFACPKCGKIYYPLTNGMDRILLAEGEKLYECQTGRNPMDKDTVTGLIVENRQASAVSLCTPDKKPYVTLNFDAPLFGLWSPAGKGAPFICIEPWYGRCDKTTFDGSLEQREYSNTLQAGEVFRKEYTITIE